MIRIPDGTWARREALLVGLIALHSYLVGALLLFASSWSVQFGGWPAGGTLFFTRQGGAFHFIIATLYLIDYFRRDSILPIVLAKSVAVVFLGSLSVRGEPWLVPASAVMDGLMLISVLVVRALRRSHDGAGPP
jgi:hypothetical protein